VYTFSICVARYTFHLTKFCACSEVGIVFLCRLFVTKRLCLQGRAIDQAVGRRIFTREAGGRSQTSPRNVSGLQSDTVTRFSPNTSVLCQYHSTKTPYSSSSTYCCNWKSRRAQLETTKQSNILSNIERELDMKVLLILPSLPDL
jgi:hypothetical protein